MQYKSDVQDSGIDVDVIASGQKVFFPASTLMSLSRTINNDLLEMENGFFEIVFSRRTAMPCEVRKLFYMGGRVILNTQDGDISVSVGFIRALIMHSRAAGFDVERLEPSCKSCGGT